MPPQQMRCPIKKWSYEEKVLFKQLVKQYGTEFGRYEEHFRDRTRSQLKSFYYAHLIKKEKTEVATVQNTGLFHESSGEQEVKMLWMDMDFM